MNPDKVRVTIQSAVCPRCGPRLYWTYDDTGERVEIPGPMEIIPGEALNASCSCGEQMLVEIVAR